MVLVSCDRGKTKSKHSVTEVDWTVGINWSLTMTMTMVT